ncbi:hypothetical protein GGF44_003335, partial [Coemansia sp. RSA 1694]
ACQSRWMLNEEYQYSIECWASKIGSKNMLINWRGNRVPYPTDTRFRSKDSGSRLSFGFWTPFQQEMWGVFLTKDVGPCYLDAVFDLHQSGFQLWTLLFEYGGLTVPVSFLMTTSVTTRLLFDWLTEIARASGDVPKRTMYVNTMKAYDFVESAFPDWDIRYSKYYITQELRELVLRADSEGTYDKGVVREVQRINTSFLAAFKELRKVAAVMSRMNYIFSMAHRWIPTTNPELALFDHSSDALSRWRYLLWMTMLGRPTMTRIDLVLYYLHAVLLPGVEGAYRRRREDEGDDSLGLVPFSMDSMEYGGSPLHESVDELQKRHLSGSLICLTKDVALAQKIIVDLELQVCFCDGFRQNKICPHLVYCTPFAVHYPALPRLLQDIPSA